MFRGTGTALVTPFAEGRFDEESFRRFIDFQVEGGVEALIVLGTTGEAPSVSEEERTEIISCAVATAAGRVPVIVGTGSNSTDHAVSSSLRAQDLGADGVLVVTPYYNKPTQEGLYRHFREVAKAISIPMVIYNVPGRTGCNIHPDTVLRLADLENVAGIKEASGDMAQVDDLIRRVKKVRSEFKVYSGNDDQAFHLVCSGGDGVISVLSNVVPRETSTMIRSALDEDLSAARKAHLKLFPMMKGLFVETNPIPVKYAVARIGYCSQEIRLPLVPLSEKARDGLDCLMDELGL